MERPEGDPLWPERLLFVGCGNMAGAILSRWLDCGLPPYRVQVVRPSGKPFGRDVEVVTHLEATVTAGTWIVLGFKPQQLSQVAAEIGPFLGHHPRLLSILAGVPVAQLEQCFPDAAAIVRCMPNLPVRTGQGVSLFYPGRGIGVALQESISITFRLLGLVEWLDDEALFDAATALSGCGPAFVYRFIDALAKAGAALGLDPAMAARMAQATVAGASISAVQSDASPDAMADAVASKGGMTRQGLDVLDEDAALNALIERTLRAARDRGAELARLAKG
ncbi:MAG: pyrroline-5-carboxylate reductase [Sphingobium sp.]|nr:pyrroline-5-carboxylate reductase [Sphingobium sp.]